MGRALGRLALHRQTRLNRKTLTRTGKAQVTDDRDRLVATGRVRLIVLEPDSEADGITVELNIKPE